MTITQTTPASTPLDTLKALALRNIDRLEYVIDTLGGSSTPPADDVFEFLDMLKDAQYAALGEHMPVTKHPEFEFMRELPPEAYRYDDGSSVCDAFMSEGVTSIFYPRYDGTYEEGRARHEEAVRQFRTPRLRAVEDRGHDGPVHDT